MINKILIKTFDALNNFHLCYVVLRNYEHFPDKISNDIDLLIEQNECQEILAVLKKSINEHGFICVIEPLNFSGFLCKGIKINSDGTTTVVCFHLQYWISCEINSLQKQIKGLSNKIFISQIVREYISINGCNIFIPAIKDKFCFLLRQWTFKKKPEYRQQLIELSFSANVEGLLKQQHCSTLSFEKFLDQPDKFESLYISILLMHWGRQNLLTSYYKAAASFFIKSQNVFAPILYISGPDGAGKTSISAMIKTTLNKINIKHKHVYSIKRNIFKHTLIQLKSIFLTRVANVSPTQQKKNFRFILTEDITDRDDGSKIWRLRKFTTLLLSIFDVFLNIIPLTYFRLKYSFVIVETSPYDIFIKYHMPRFNCLETLFCPLFPAPTKGLLLIAKADLISSRKDELEQSEIIQYYKRLDIVLDKGGVKNKFINIRTDIDIDETNAAVCRVISSFI